MMMKTHQWRGVPLDKREVWSELFGQSQEGINLSAPCPVCGVRTLHRYYLTGKLLDRYIDGEHFVADGSSWEWCSTCYSYEHSRTLIPNWWHETLDVSGYELTAEPEAVERARTQKGRRHDPLM